MNGGGMARMSVLERQQALMKWQEQPGYFTSGDQLNNTLFSGMVSPAQHFHGLIVNDQNLGGLSTVTNHSGSVGVGGGGESFGFGDCELGNVACFGLNYGVSRTASCPPAVAAALAEAASASTKRKETITPEKLSSSSGKDSFKKRKADKPPCQKAAAATEEQSKDSKRKGCMEEEESKVTEQQKSKDNKTEPSETSKENSKVSEVQKPDYIHVRARRGQATDSHSLAERVRREKISERMKYLQDLVPGCNKITGKAGMLDEIINYVQSLQRQVEFLSMKLAAVNPRLDLDIDNIFSKEIFPVGTHEPHVIQDSSEMNNPQNYPLASLDKVVSCCGIEADKNLPDMVLRRTISAPVSLPETLIESPYFNQIHPYATWDAELQQSIYAMEFQQGRSALLLSQPCAGFDGGSNNVKIEM